MWGAACKAGQTYSEIQQLGQNVLPGMKTNWLKMDSFFFKSESKWDVDWLVCIIQSKYIYICLIITRPYHCNQLIDW